MCEPNHHTIRQNSFVVKRVSVYIQTNIKTSIPFKGMIGNYDI